ncbi:hypothetical protein KC363_g5597 [Hortaea werneckii]|nr:hypothetical protein KC325_g5970 [Hortaea werneckii]KAI6990851.1 hypothetical protein KC359_g6491 [Hortaea werneckii]KAI7143905.1 hypothetical protein KC344_g5855 [Hortaea werneckii]KAI7171692.1 hypothetical protein KC360_g5992 [Hortaea werneckii]KAI7188223.1 hypothetical protein KC363_g5597 [Hortaea werneckii]
MDRIKEEGFSFELRQGGGATIARINQINQIIEADKTGLIHFTSVGIARSGQVTAEALPLNFQGTEIHPQESLKVLGVTLDTRLKMDTHISKVTAKALGKCIALQSVKGLRPRQMRQLYWACVIPTVDYAASAWYGPKKWGTEGLLHRLGQVQRLGARVILRAFRQKSLEVLEAEACLETAKDRLTRRTARHAGKLLAAEQGNPAREALLISTWSNRDGRASIRVVQQTGQRSTLLQGASIGRQSTCSVLAAKLTAIRQALKLGIGSLFFTDSTKALAAIQAGNKATSSRAILRDISLLLRQRVSNSESTRLAWCLGHKGIPSNERANTVPRQATAVQGKPTAPVDERIRELKGVLQLMEQDRTDNPTLTRSHRRFGNYTWQLDQALPGKHTLALYGNISSEEASVLI